MQTQNSYTLAGEGASFIFFDQPVGNVGWNQLMVQMMWIGSCQWPVEGGNWEKIQKLKDRYDRLARQALKVAARSALLDDTKQI